MNKSRFLLLALFALVMGSVSPAWGQELTIYGDADYSSDYVPFDGYDADAVQQDQMIIPSSVLTSLSGKKITSMTFYYKKNETSGTNVGDWIVSLAETSATTLSALDTTTPLTQVYSGAITPNTDAKTITITFDNGYVYNGGNLLVEFNHPTASGYKKFTFWCTYVTPAPAFSKGATRTYLPKTTFTYEDAAVSGPALAVKDGSTKLTSPANYNFGLATAGTTKTFTLSNPGTADLGISVSETGNFGATLSATTIPAGGEVTLTVTMPASTGSSAVTITPASGSGIDPFVLNVSGTVRDPNKLYEYGFTALPSDWTTIGSWYYSAANGAYTTVWYLSSNARLVTPLLTVADGETFFVEAKGYSTSNTSYQHLQMQYSADGTTWTNFDSEPTLDPSNWQTFTFTGVPAGKYYIAINASQADVRMFYGGQLPLEPKMQVTQPTSLDYGVITAATDKTFTIANTGLATLEGISVTSSNPLFTISNAPTSLAAGASQDVTITMAATTTGALSSDITVSATDMENVQFTVTGVVLPDGMFVVDFNDNQLPANWENNASYKWSFADGKAYCTSAAELTTPALQFADGDMLAIKITSYDNYDDNYLEITGSADGTTWDAFTTKRYISRSEIPYGSYATLIVTGIPTTTKYLKFKGYYVRIDELAGLTYAPTVTYNFANAGAGNINITNVAVTGDGAAAYSTNWTASVAAPFDLVITRNYDATRAGTAQNAVVTVTTSEGDFVINVTGTDKAANAPEIAVDQTSLDFGKLTANSTITVTVTNAGTGSMDVAIASDNELFTLSATALTGIGAGESQTFDVTFNYTNVAGNYGTKSANITVTPSYDATAFVTIAATAKAADPNVWTEDFSANTVPTGWIAENNWTVADGAAKASYAYGTTTYLTTPTLTVSDASEELTFDYKATANYVSIKIQMSKDGAAFTDYNTISGLNNGNAGTYTITGLEAGEYQFRFANDDYELDNFEGFKLNMADHLLTFTATSIPAAGNQYVEYTATATVKELAGKDEELTAKFFIGGTQYGGNVVKTVSANGTETFTVTFTPDAAVSGDAYFTVSNDDVSLESDKTAVTIAEALVLDETVAATLTDGNAPIVVVKYTAKTGWNTITMPFNLSNDDLTDIFGTGWKAYELKGFDGTSSLEFKESTQFYAGYAYIVNSVEPANNTLYKQNVTIVANPKNDSYNGATFYGTYAPMAAGTMTGKYGVTTEGRIAKGSASATMKGFRGYLELPDNVSNVRITLPGGEVLTGINTMDNGQLSTDNEAYDLQGRRVQNAKKGFFIINGKKVVK